MKCEVVDGSVVNGSRQSMLYSFNLDIPAGYKVISAPETILYQKTDKICFENKIIFYLENDNHEEVDFK